MASSTLQMPRISPLAILIALVAGLGGGILLSNIAPGAVAATTDPLDVIGTLWLRGLQMTIVPLVVSLLITGIVTAVAAASAGRIAGWSIGFFFAVLWGGAIMAAIVTPLLLQAFPIPAEAAASMVGSLGGIGEVADPPPFSEFIKQMVPTNPITAAANDAILPLLVFTAVFALAITRLPDEPRKLLSNLFDAIGDAMLVVIGWVLVLAPVGVFALAFVVAARTGADAIGVFLHYILIVSSIGIIVWAAGYPIAVFGGKRRLTDFVRAVLPAQAVAISTQSSLASLPAMLRGAKMLNVRETTADVTLPLAVALFRSTGPAMNLAVVIYVAWLTGVELSPATLAIGVAVAATTTLGAVSLPGSISFISSCGPIALAMGVPIEPLALLIAVEQLPDIVRTLGNVTNDTAAVATVDARAGSDATETTVH
jgi:proton glutamate symport protein